MKKVNKFYTIKEIVASESGELPTEIELMKVGTYQNHDLGPFEVTTADLDHFVESYERGIRAKGEYREDNSLPINCRHDKEGEAAGWIKGLAHKGDGVLRATVEWTTLGVDKLKNKLYKYISPEWWFVYPDPETGEEYRNVIVGAGLTNIPYFKKLKPLVASEVTVYTEGDTMKLDEIVAKEVTELTAEEKAFVKENKSLLVGDQVEKFKEITADEPPAGEGEGEGDGKPVDPPADPPAPVDPPTPPAPAPAGEGEGAEGDKKVEITASELNSLKEKAEKFEAAEKELVKRKLTDEVKLMCASETNAGTLLPKHVDQVVELLTAMEGETATKFRAFLKALPEIKAKGGEAGSGEGSGGNTASEKIEALVKEFQASEDGKGKTYRQSLNAVLDKNPELKQQYINEHPTAHVAVAKK